MNDASETTPRPTVLIVGDPLNGFEYFGPFPSPAAALEYQETGLQDCRPSWAAPLLPDPLHADSSDSSPRTWYGCPDCGCTDVEGQCWYRLNTNETTDDAGGECWCPQCEDHFKHPEEYAAPKPYNPDADAPGDANDE